MSNIVTSLLRSRNLGVGLTGKALLLFMGDLASDDGSGIWAAKSRIARELETTDRTVQRTIDKLMQDGFVSETGRRKHRNGYTFEYQIDVQRVAECPESKTEPPTERRVLPQDVDASAQDMTPDTVSPPTHRHPTPDTPSPQDPTHRHPNPNRTTDEPQLPPISPAAEKARIMGHLTGSASPEAARSFIAYRRKIKKPLTETAAKRLGTTLDQIAIQGGSPDDALGLAEERGWQSIQADWYFKNSNRLPHRSEHRPDAALEQIARIAGIGRA